jgi:SagB-type dehydrogenase family enzyme
MRAKNLVVGFSLGCLLLSAVCVAVAGADIALEKPRPSLGVDIMEALQMRKSTKSYTFKEISVQDLSNLLWAANGVNRKSGKRTAPSSYGRQYTDLYVVSDQGVYFYDPVKHSLSLVTNENIKNQIALQKYVEEASHIIVMVSDSTRIHPRSKNRVAAVYGGAGCIAQNIYLTACAMDLGTCLVVGLKADVIREKLQLPKHQTPVFIMPLGYPNH